MLQCRAIRSAGGWPRFSTQLRPASWRGLVRYCFCRKCSASRCAMAPRKRSRFLLACWPAGQARPASGRSRDGGVGHCAVRQVPAARGRRDPPGDGRRPRRGPVHHEQSPRFPADDQGGRDHLSGRPAWRPQLRARPRSAEGGLRTAYCDRFRWPIVSASRSQSGANAR
jgi:hypothetical protein